MLCPQLLQKPKPTMKERWSCLPRQGKAKRHLESEAAATMQDPGLCFGVDGEQIAQVCLVGAVSSPLRMQRREPTASLVFDDWISCVLREAARGSICAPT